MQEGARIRLTHAEHPGDLRVGQATVELEGDQVSFAWGESGERRPNGRSPKLLLGPVFQRLVGGGDLLSGVTRAPPAPQLVERSIARDAEEPCPGRAPLRREAVAFAVGALECARRHVLGQAPVAKQAGHVGVDVIPIRPVQGVEFEPGGVLGRWKRHHERIVHTCTTTRHAIHHTQIIDTRTVSFNLDVLDRVHRRREAVLILGGLVVSALWQAACGSGSSKTSKAAAPDCILTPEATEGPFYVADNPTRRDITDGRPGLPLALDVTVVDGDSCEAIENAHVEIWHADASGVYSGIDDSKRLLRGHQKSDARGGVVFDTIYPGWYSGRAPHIHMKVHVGGSEVHTGQLFFDERTSSRVYETSAYASRGEADVTNERDTIYAAAGGGGAQVRLTRSGEGYKGRFTVGVRA